MINKPKKKLRSRGKRRGAAAIEMALVAPFVLFLVFTSIEFSRMMMVRQAMTNAAREGCRRATLVTSRDYETADEALRERLKPIIPSSLNEEIVRTEFSPTATGNLATGTRIEVTVEVDCKDVSWLPPFVFAGAKIKTYSSMIRE